MRRAKYFEYFEDLINLAITREQRSLLSHLREDAASGPEVDAEGVVLLGEQDLRAAVP